LPTKDKIPPAHVITPMANSDIDEVVRIEQQSFPNPWTWSMFDNELLNPVSSAYTVKVPQGGGSLIAGYIIFWVVYGEAHILNIAVHPDFRRMGFAKELLDAAIEDMKRLLVYEVFLEVRRSNEAARSLYRLYGFKESFERKKYYGDEDAIVMALEL